jgi:hypothetical protein
MSKRIEPCLFRCDKCQHLSGADDSTVTFESAGVLRLCLPKGWAARSTDLHGHVVLSFACPECAALIGDGEDHSTAMIDRIFECESSADKAEADAAKQLLRNLRAIADGDSASARLVLDVIEKHRQAKGATP